MKKLLVLSLVFPFFCFGQPEHIRIKKEKPTAFFGNIAGYTDGEINYSLLCDESGISCSADYIVDQFTVRYGQKECIIYGKNLPDTICRDIGNCCQNDMIFCTNITGFHKTNGERIFVYPLNLIITKDD